MGRSLSDAKQLLDRINADIQGVVRNVNQRLLLKDLHETRVCRCDLQPHWLTLMLFFFMESFFGAIVDCSDTFRAQNSYMLITFFCSSLLVLPNSSDEQLGQSDMDDETDEHARILKVCCGKLAVLITNLC